MLGGHGRASRWAETPYRRVCVGRRRPLAPGRRAPITLFCGCPPGLTRSPAATPRAYLRAARKGIRYRVKHRLPTRRALHRPASAAPPGSSAAGRPSGRAAASQGQPPASRSVGSGRYLGAVHGGGLEADERQAAPVLVDLRAEGLLEHGAEAAPRSWVLGRICLDRCP